MTALLEYLDLTKSISKYFKILITIIITNVVCGRMTGNKELTNVGLMITIILKLTKHLDTSFHDNR